MPIPLPYLYGIGLLIACLPKVSSASALLLGLVLSLGFQFPLPTKFKKLAKIFLQASIVLMGFSMDPTAVWRAGTSGVLLTAGSLAITLALGYHLAKVFRVPQRLGMLLTVGTAICGGSAIAAMAPVLGADNDETAVSLGTVFLLNAVALMLFPSVGVLLGMSPEAFGLFAAIAIHDTSSVVGAATAYADASVPIATTVKLTRALWILPLSFGTALFLRRSAAKTGAAKGAVPWFILGFVAAVGIRAALPQLQLLYGACGELGKAGLKGAIFLISAQMSRASLRRVGARPLQFALALWAAVIVVALVMVYVAH